MRSWRLLRPSIPLPTSKTESWLEGCWAVGEIRPQPSDYYELWFVSGEKRISAGSFTSVGQGETRVLLNVPPEASNYYTLLITEEHVGKRPAPSQEVALRGTCPNSLE